VVKRQPVKRVPVVDEVGDNSDSAIFELTLALEQQGKRVEHSIVQFANQTVYDNSNKITPDTTQLLNRIDVRLRHNRSVRVSDKQVIILNDLHNWHVMQSKVCCAQSQCII